jgi:hypothetical protein
LSCGCSSCSGDNRAGLASLLSGKCPIVGFILCGSVCEKKQESVELYIGTARCNRAAGRIDVVPYHYTHCTTICTYYMQYEILICIQYYGRTYHGSRLFGDHGGDLSIFRAVVSLSNFQHPRNSFSRRLAMRECSYLCTIHCMWGEHLPKESSAYVHMCMMQS